MTDTLFYFDPAANKITAIYNTRCTEITKDQIARLVRQGAEVDQSARDLNDLLKRSGQ